MTTVRTTRSIVLAAFLALLGPLLLAPASWAAKPPAASVTVTAPTSGTTSLLGGVTMSGKASVPTGASLVLTVDGSVTGSPVTVAKSGTWSRYVYVGRVGVHRLCGEVRGSGAVLASACVTWEMLPDPAQFSLASPYEGQVTYDAVQAGGGCQPGATVRLTLDGGTSLLEACDPDGYGWGHLYEQLSVGDHELVAQLLGNDGSVVATRSVTWTVRPTPVPDVTITSPQDGASGTGRAVTLSGEMENVNGSLAFTIDGYDAYDRLEVGYVTTRTTWEHTVYPPYGTHQLCVTAPWFDGASDTDCITYTALVPAETFSLDAPQDGGVVEGPLVTFVGSCYPGSTVSVVLDDGSSADGTCTEWSSWYVQVDGVSAGDHSATVTNTFDGREVTSVTTGFTVDTTPPDAPVVLSPKSGSTISSVPALVFGQGDPLGEVTISYAGTDYPYQATTVAEDGSWMLTLDRDWFESAGVLTGRRATVTATVTQVDRFGRPSPATTVTWTTRVR